MLRIGAAGTASAQNGLNLAADIPFEFTVGSTTLPAGTYAVEDRTVLGMIVVRSTDGSRTGLAVGIPAQAKATAGQAKLVFNRYGDRHFLAQVWTSSGNWGCEIRKDRSQRELAHRAANHERVMILAKR